MDILNPKLLNANRAKSIFSNTKKRLKATHKKTDEEYLRILLDEINKYFSLFNISTINESELPTTQDGPDSEKHNEFITRIVNDLDNIRGKHKTAEEMITKSVNYISNERLSILESSSVLYSRIIAHQLKTSINDKNKVIFSEYFNDYGLTNVKESIGIEVDSGKSALMLQAELRNSDNSELIDPDSIKITIDSDEEFGPFYPLCNGKNGDSYQMAYGQTLRDIVETHSQSYDPNVVDASDGFSMGFPTNKEKETNRVKSIQGQSLLNGTEDDTGMMSHCEFECIYSDFPRLENKIKESMLRNSINAKSVFIDYTKGFSFFGARDIPVPGSFPSIKKLVLNFSLKKGIKLSGNLSKIAITFNSPLDIGGDKIPEIDAGLSCVNGEKIFLPNVDSVVNAVTQKRTLIVNQNITDPRRFSIIFNLKGDEFSEWKEVKQYQAAYWEYYQSLNKLEGDLSILGHDINGGLSTSTALVYYIYHDLRRTNGNMKEENLSYAKNIISTNMSKLSEMSEDGNIST